MDLDIISITSEEFNTIEKQYQIFLRNIQKSDSPALDNMGNSEKGGLLYLAKNLKRWTNGEGQISFLIDRASGAIVGISAVEHSTLHESLGSGGNRCWLLPKYRMSNHVSNYLLAANLDWCKDQDKAGMILTFNDYNKWIYDTVVRITNGKSAGIGTVWSNWWNDCLILPRKVRLHYTNQWAIIKPLSSKKVVDEIIIDIDKKFGVRDKIVNFI